MVLQTALRETVRWQRDHGAHSDLHIAVNVSGKQLQDAGIVDDVRLAIKASGIAAIDRGARDHRERAAAR